MKRQVRIALVQLAAHDRNDFSRSTPELLEKIRLSTDGVDLVVFPEGTLPAYVLGEAPFSADEISDAMTALQQCATDTGTHIIGGVAWQADRQSAQQPLNAAAVFHPDGRIDVRAKTFLWHFDRRWYRASEEILPVDTALGKLGVMVCADGRIPTLARSLIDSGAEMLVMPTAWVSSGADAKQLDNIQADLMGRMRAWENGVPFAAANKVGVERQAVLYCGKSQICDADGNVVAMGSPTAAETVRATVEIGSRSARRTAREYTPAARSGAVETAQNPSLTPQRVGLALRLNSELYEMARFSDVDLLLTVRSEKIADTATPRIVEINRLPYAQINTVAGLQLCVLNDHDMADPAYPAALRERGVCVLIWRAENATIAAQRQLARLRAIELRVYVILVAEAHPDGACIIDPEGVVLAGTTEHLRLAQATIDPTKSLQTQVAPSTDILVGLRAVHERAPRIR